MEMIFTQDITIKKMFLTEEYFKQRKGVWVLQRQGDKKLSESCGSHEEKWRWSFLSF